MVEIGQKAPDFIASAVADGEGTVIELFAEIRRHEAAVLIFQPAAFVPTGTAEFVAVRDAKWHSHPELFVVGLTGDSLYSHAAYAEQFDLPFPLLSDFHGSVAESYDLLIEEWEGHSAVPARATVVIDDDWELRAVEKTEPLSERSPAPVERATEAIQALGVDVTPATPEFGAF